MVINFKKTNENAKVPTRGSKYSAGLDLYANIEGNAVDIPAGATVKIGTGICVEIPDGFFGAVFARSGIATKRGLRPANCVGVVDSDYRGEVIVPIHNDTNQCETIIADDRIAQLIIIPYIHAVMNEVDELSDTTRGNGGFGSTDFSNEHEHKQFSLFN